VQIFVAGATGVLGRRLLPELVRRGHDVVGLARDPGKQDLVRSLGGRPATASLFDPEALARAAEGADVVVHAATAIPTSRAARFRKSWSMNDRIRRDGTRALAGAAGAIGARHYIQQSVAWVVRTGPGKPAYDEGTPPDPPELIRSAVDGEEIAREAGNRHGFTVGVVRDGFFYGPIGQTRAIIDLLRKRRMPVIGRGEFLVAPLHIEDAATAFAMAAEAGVDGTWNAVDDEPVPFRSFLSRLAGEVGAPEPRRIPPWIARLALGGPVFESMTTSMNTSNARIREELGWRPAYPTIREGMAGLA
jgi:nucleoside-diphosphate-sugar epimerase